MINKVTLIGNLGGDPEIRTLENGTKVGRLTIATNENYRDKNNEWQKMTEWHNVVVWRYVAERAEQYMKKGMQVFVEGKLQTRKWQDKDGNDRYTTEVVAREVKILGRREDTNSGGTNNSFPSTSDAPPTYSGGANTSSNASTSTASNVAEETVADDLPF